MRSQNIHTFLVSGFIGVIAASIIAAGNITRADHDLSCGGLESMPKDAPSGKYYECNQSTKAWELKDMPGSTTGGGGTCTGMSAPTGQWYEWDPTSSSCILRGTPTGGGSIADCGNRPAWPDCADDGVVCYNGSWRCDRMKDGTGGTGGSDCYSRCIAEPQSPAICNTRCYSPGGIGGEGSTSFADCMARECSTMVTDATRQTCENSCRSQFGGGGDNATCTACITAGGTQSTCPTCPGYTGGGYGGTQGGNRGGGNVVCVADCVALTPGICQGSVPEGQRRVCDFKRDKNWSGSACEELCNGGSGGGGPGGKNCRDWSAYEKCIGGPAASTPSNSELARSCEQKYCWYQGGDSGGTGGEGEVCRRNCEEKMRNCQRRASVAYSPMWCDQTLEECIAQCPGSGGKKPPEGCRGTPPTSEQYGKWECVYENGQWDWMFKKTEEPKTFCEAFPTHEKCKKIEPKPKPRDQERVEKLESLEKQIALVEDKIAILEEQIDATEEKFQMMKVKKAKKTEINKVKKAAKKLIKQHRKLEQKLSRLNQKYNLLSQ